MCHTIALGKMPWIWLVGVGEILHHLLTKYPYNVPETRRSRRWGWTISRVDWRAGRRRHPYHLPHDVATYMRGEVGLPDGERADYLQRRQPHTLPLNGSPHLTQWSALLLQLLPPVGDACCVGLKQGGGYTSQAGGGHWG